MKPVSILLAVSFLSLYANPGFALPEAFEVGPENANALPGGKEADGIAGDFILRNDQIEALISGDQPRRKTNMGTFWSAVSPGCLYDLTLRGENITAYPDAEGNFAFRMPPGNYQLKFRDSGRDDVARTVRVSPQEDLEPLQITMTDPARITFHITSPDGASLPCKAPFHGIRGTPSPDLGPPNRAHDSVGSETWREFSQFNPLERKAVEDCRFVNVEPAINALSASAASRWGEHHLITASPPPPRSATCSPPPIASAYPATGTDPEVRKQLSMTDGQPPPTM